MEGYMGPGYGFLEFLANFAVINYSLYHIHHFWAHPSCIPLCLQQLLLSFMSVHFMDFFYCLKQTQLSFLIFHE